MQEALARAPNLHAKIAQIIEKTKRSSLEISKAYEK
jgi:hypothetical protein